MDESLRREFWVLTLARKRIVICRGELRLDSESGLASFVMDGRELSVEAGDVPVNVRRPNRRGQARAIRMSTMWRCCSQRMPSCSAVMPALVGAPRA